MTRDEIRQKAREAFEKFWISTNNSNFFADRQISITDLKTVAFESWIMATAFGESLLSGGADSGTPAEATPDNYVAWCRYIRTGDFARIETCDSDAPGAFKVYRGAAPPAASPQPLLERIPNAGDQRGDVLRHYFIWEHPGGGCKALGHSEPRIPACKL